MGLDGAVGSDQQDLVTVMLHELAHGFGVSHSFAADGTFGYQSGEFQQVQCYHCKLSQHSELQTDWHGSRLGV